MRAAIWLVVLFAVAVALALLAGNNHAMVTVFWPPQRIDISLNFAALLLLSLFVLIYVVLRTLSVFFALPATARRWRAQNKERAMYAAFLDAVVHLLAGRFIRARKLAQVALQQEQSFYALLDAESSHHGRRDAQAAQMRCLAHLVVAQCAQSLQNQTLRDEHFAQAMHVASVHKNSEMQDGLLLRAARWALDDLRASVALDWLNKLPLGSTRRTAALRLKLRATQQAGQTLQALETARLLVKHHAFTTDVARSLIRSLAAELIERARDLEHLQRIWSNLDAKERAMPELVVQAAARHMALGGDAALARAWLLHVWEDMVHHERCDNVAWRVKFVQALQAGLDDIDTVWLARIETAQQQRPLDEYLQYLAGMACLKRQLWGKAQQLLSQAAGSLQSLSLQLKAWQALAELAQQRGDSTAELQAYKKMASLSQSP